MQNRTYNREMDRSATLLLERMAASGNYDGVLLEDLYERLCALNSSDRNGVQWGVRRAKDAGILKRVYSKGGKLIQGVYRFA